MSQREAYGIGSFLHVYNRGAGRAPIFLEEADYERFLIILYLTNGSETDRPSDYDLATLAEAVSVERGDTLTDVTQLCLMPNHFHIEAREKIRGGTSRYMQRALTAYTKYFNAKYGNSGCVMQGPFQSRTVTEDRHFQQLTGYIQANPLDLMENLATASVDEAVAFLRSYRFSSFQDLAGVDRAEGRILCPDAAKFVGTPDEFKSRMRHYVTGKLAALQNPQARLAEVTRKPRLRR